MRLWMLKTPSAFQFVELAAFRLLASSDHGQPYNNVAQILSNRRSKSSSHHFIFFAPPILGNDNPNKLPDDFTRVIPKHSLSSKIPGGDAQSEIRGDDRIFR